MKHFLPLATAVIISACGSSGSFSLKIVLPDDDARNQTTNIRVVVIEPSEQASCDDLTQRKAIPGDDGYRLLTEISFDYPPSGQIERLENIGPGEIIFYAEAKNTYGGVILNGCSRVATGSQGPHNVTIDLDWVTACLDTNGGVETCDGLDNDCDGYTDDLSATELCDELPAAVASACMHGSCVYACSDGYVNVNDDWSDGCECRITHAGQELCDGLDNDCDGQTDGATCTACGSDADCTDERNCLVGLCTAGVCSLTASPDGTACDDGDNCSGHDQCNAGLCAGTPGECDDGFLCTESDVCDQAGHCAGTPIEGYCAAGEECRPECATDEFGCVQRPNWMQLDCPERVGLDQPAVCSVQLHGGEGSESCAHCTVKLVPSVLDDTDFYTNGCDLGDWQFEDSGCQSGGSAWCPFTSGGDGQACHTTSDCSASDQALDFKAIQNGDNGWRISRLFPGIDAFDSLRLCYRILERSPSFEGSLEVLADKDDGSDPMEIGCDGANDWSGQLPTDPCIDLPLTVADWPQARLTFWTQVALQDSEILLANTRLYGFPPECKQQTAVVDTHFTGCGVDAAQFEGWNFYTPATCDDTQETGCDMTGGLLLGTMNGQSTSSISASYDLDLQGVRAPGRLCWKHYHSAGFDGGYTVAFSGGTGGVWYVQVYEFVPPPIAFNPVCRDICIDLAQLGSIFGSTDSRVSFSGQATSGGLLINNVRLEASSACDATGLFDVGAVEPDGQGGFQVEVSDTLESPRRALLQCSWGSGAIGASREIEFTQP
ncbi:MAG TPA: MopE-related protein [Myxococcota bacterium]|nr:MopE-related protein [Myxococcota bacterium]